MAATVSTPTKSNHFESVVRERLLRNKLAGQKPDSIRGLARAMARGDLVRAETFKRSLFKWMAPGEPHPSPESRAIVAAALGIDRGELADPDDEEGDPAMREAFTLFVDLLDQIGSRTSRPVNAEPGRLSVQGDDRVPTSGG